jgi:hypothetical protein
VLLRHRKRLSIINTRLHADRIGFLTGSITSAGHPSGKQLVDDFAAALSWVGEPRSGGARALPRADRGICAAGRIASATPAAGVPGPRVRHRLPE